MITPRVCKDPSLSEAEPEAEEGGLCCTHA